MPKTGLHGLWSPCTGRPFLAPVEGQPAGQVQRKGQKLLLSPQLGWFCFSTHTGIGAWGFQPVPTLKTMPSAAESPAHGYPGPHAGGRGCRPRPSAGPPRPRCAAGCRPPPPAVLRIADTSLPVAQAPIPTLLQHLVLFSPVSSLCKSLAAPASRNGAFPALLSGSALFFLSLLEHFLSCKFCACVASWHWSYWHKVSRNPVSRFSEVMRCSATLLPRNSDATPDCVPDQCLLPAAALHISRPVAPEQVVAAIPLDLGPCDLEGVLFHRMGSPTIFFQGW